MDKIKHFPLTLDLQWFAGERSITIDGQTFEIDDGPASGAGTGSNDDDFDADDVLNDIEIDDEGIDFEDGADDAQEGAEDAEESIEGEDTGQAEDAPESDSEPESADADAEKSDAKKDKGDNPIAKAVIAERKRLQAQMAELRKQAAIAEKLMKLVGVSDIADLQARLDAAEAAKIAKEKGIAPELAMAQLQQQRELDRQRAEIRRLKYAQEIAELKRDPFFADIEDFREEFEEIAERTGQTLAEVYMAKRGRQRMKEMEREIEQRVLAKQQQRQKAKVDTTPSGAPVVKQKVNLPPDALAAAEAAVKMGIFESVAEYAKYYKPKG